MNRRHFIKTAVAAAIALPTISASAEIVNSLILTPKPETVRVDGECIHILTIKELRQHGIRSAIYSANCVDRYGKFAHEQGYYDLGLGDTEPFVRKTIRLQCLPKIYSDDTARVMTLIGKIRAGGQEYSLTNIIEEIKKIMEYVCLVAYAKTPCICGHASCKPYYIPIVGGLSKYRYQLYLKQMNGIV